MDYELQKALVVGINRVAAALEKQNETAEKLMKVFPDEVLDKYATMLVTALEQMEDMYEI